jgi:hypothetical protein
MTETLQPVASEVDQQRLAEQLLAQAREQGVDLVGPNGLLNQLTKTVLETALEAEMSEHLGYDKHDPAGRNRGNSRNGTRAKTVLTEIGPVTIEVPRDTDATFDPQIVRKRLHLARARRRACGISSPIALTKGRVEPVRRPLPNVAGHVEQAVAVGRKHAIRRVARAGQLGQIGGVTCAGRRSGRRP